MFFRPRWMRSRQVPVRKPRNSFRPHLEALEDRFCPAAGGGGPPVAVADAFSQATDGTIAVAATGILGNDTGADLVAVQASSPSHGSVTSFGGDGSFTYSASPGFVGADSFSYYAQNADGTSDTVSIDLQIALALVGTVSASADEGTELSTQLGTLYVADSSAPDTAFTVSIDWGDSQVGSATLVAAGAGVWEVHGSHTYADNGSYQITLSASDAGGSSSTATVAATVADVAPTLSLSGNATVDEGTTYFLTLDASDPGDDAVQYWTVNWGDGSDPETVFGNTTSAAHVFAANSSGGVTITASATNEDGTFAANPLALQVNNLAPTISLDVSYLGQKTVTLFGQVSDYAPGGLTVTFTGEVNTTTVTDENGNFSITLDADGLGNVQASVSDVGALSGTATVTLTSDLPVIFNFAATQVLGNCWTFSGTVADETAPGLIVSLGGLTTLSSNNVSATVDENGNFTVTVELASGECGTATAVVTDWWGLKSDEASYSI